MRTNKSGRLKSRKEQEQVNRLPKALALPRSLRRDYKPNCRGSALSALKRYPPPDIVPVAESEKRGRGSLLRKDGWMDDAMATTTHQHH